jgi:hypothetical protein
MTFYFYIISDLQENFKNRTEDYSVLFIQRSGYLLLTTQWLKISYFLAHTPELGRVSEEKAHLPPSSISTGGPNHTGTSYNWHVSAGHQLRPQCRRPWFLPMWASAHRLPLRTVTGYHRRAQENQAEAIMPSTIQPGKHIATICAMAVPTQIQGGGKETPHTNRSAMRGEGFLYC